jgi:hypothetical protein
MFNVTKKAPKHLLKKRLTSLHVCGKLPLQQLDGLEKGLVLRGFHCSIAQSLVKSFVQLSTASQYRTMKIQQLLFLYLNP